MRLAWIKDLYSENTGGNCYVDVIVMHNGQVLTLTDESIVIYSCMEAYEDGVEDGRMFL